MAENGGAGISLTCPTASGVTLKTSAKYPASYALIWKRWESMEKTGWSRDCSLAGAGGSRSRTE